MSQSFENPPMNPPPPKKSGMSTLMIVLIVLGLGGLVCCGICGSCFYFGAGAVVPAAHAGVAMPRIQTNDAVLQKFGGRPELEGLPTSSNASLQQGTTSTVEFDIRGPGGKGHVHLESTMTPNGPEPKVITVTAPDGSTINVSGAVDPTDINIPSLDGIDMDEKDEQ